MTYEQSWPCPDCGGPHTMVDAVAGDRTGGHSVSCPRRDPKWWVEHDAAALDDAIEQQHGVHPADPDEGGTIRNLYGGRVIGKTDNLARTFAEHITKGGPPCLVVGPTVELERLAPYLPEWVEQEPDDTMSSTVYAFGMTRDEWLLEGERE